MKNKLSYKCQNLTVLLIEDYLPLQEKIASFLSDYFNEIHVASDGAEGLEKYITFKKEYGKHYDIVISDYEMPKLNGIELIKKIKELSTKQVFIVISAHQDPKYLIEFINLGILHFIPKPLQPQEILTVLEKVSTNLVDKDDNVKILSRTHSWHTIHKSLSYKGKYIKLSKYDILLFEILIQDIGVACSSEKILDYFYLFNEDIQKENIRNMIIRLRKKIPNTTIENLYAIGYMLKFTD